MDETVINLPCGLEITYGNFKKRQKTSRCIMCDQEDLNVDEVLSRPGNRLKLKEKELEIETENLQNLCYKYFLIKQNPRVYFEKSFERNLNELNVRKEELKKEFEKQINDYCAQLQNNLEETKLSMINQIDEDLNHKEIDIVVIKQENTSSIENAFDLKQKLESIDSNLNEIAKNRNLIKKAISIVDFADKLKLVSSNNEMNIQKLFGKIQNFNLFDYKESYVLNGHLGSILCLTKIDHNRILTGSNDKTIKLWNINERKCEMEIKDLDSISVLCWLKYELFASVSKRKIIKIWDLTNGECKMKIKAHTKTIHDMKLLSNGQLVTCSKDKTIKFWNYETGECLQIIFGHNQDVYVIEEISNNMIVSGSADFTIKLWNIENGENVKTLFGHNSSVYSLKLIDSNRLASCSADKKIKIWNLDSGECLNNLEGHEENVTKLDMLKSGHLISCDDDRTIKFWDIDSNQCLKSFNTEIYDINCFILTENEDIVIGSSDISLKILSRNF